ncbi:unnamed protein product [Caenorhabditis auriculariae]|uniref:G-protein coupled receptors family 1 profile domain-containing protein n=1 Tax=Caenorhabditis auriculariae TaxID=2777116 RepID=A0A8S1HVW1_9PELO|nr:unnamed protein product [Caenorhabditis auriculariae]
MVLDSSWNETTQAFGHKGVTFVHLLALGSGACNCVLNALIWMAFIKTPRLLQKHHLYLFYCLAVTNFFTGFFTLPTYLNLINHNNLNCPRWSILIGSSFEFAFDRIRHVITLAIALERIYALFCPGEYFFLDHQWIAIKVCTIAAVWAVFDMAFLIVEDNIFMVRVHCVTTSSSGPIFHVYFLIATIAFGVFLSLAYSVFISKLFILRGTQLINRKSLCRENFHQVNSLTVAVILMVVIFNVLPSSLYLCDMILGKVHFMKWGPIITIGYHFSGILSYFFYSYKHREIRAALNKLYPIHKITSKKHWSPQKQQKMSAPSLITLKDGDPDKTASGEIFL